MTGIPTCIEVFPTELTAARSRLHRSTESSASTSCGKAWPTATIRMCVILPTGYQEPASRVYGQDVAWRLIWQKIMASTALSVERGVDSDFSKNASGDQCPGAAT